MTKLIFCDCETTGLYPQLGHVPYEIALIDQDGNEVTLWVQLGAEQLGAADPAALRIGRFFEREPYARDVALRAFAADPVNVETLADLAKRDQPVFCSEAVAAWIVVRETAGAHLVGAVPSFDAAMLDAMVRRHQLVPAWHYHLVDVEALAAGSCKQRPPWDSEDLSEKAGVDPSRFDRHTALGDALWAKAVYDAVMGL